MRKREAKRDRGRETAIEGGGWVSLAGVEMKIWEGERVKDGNSHYATTTILLFYGNVHLKKKLNHFNHLMEPEGGGGSSAECDFSVSITDGSL